MADTSFEIIDSKPGKKIRFEKGFSHLCLVYDFNGDKNSGIIRRL